jgi:membrane fusion protein
MYDAFPYQRFGVGRGVVRTVGRAPVAPQDLPVAIETREPLYRVQVRLSRQEIDAYGRKWSLSPGARLRADLVLDERSLLTWLFDPLAAAVKREGR